MRSSLEIFELATCDVRVVLQTDRLIEAPNWDAARGALIVNGDGLLYRVSIASGEMQQIDTGRLVHLNNDHGISPDGTQLVVSDHIRPRGCLIYRLPIEGGKPTPVTKEPGTYWHGWSPDGARLAYCGLRDGRFDIYTLPTIGGEELKLTEAGHNDGPDYAPDGEWIWFNSDRTGHAQIWRMRVDGSAQEQMTDDEFVNWFPHPSPDGRHILYVAYPPGTDAHPRNKDVRLCLMSPDGGDRREVLRFNGGQGSINVPCWAPDSGAFAYVRYAPFRPTGALPQTPTYF
ncbi:MAG: TolB family protein [Silicimonas sp.]|nr:TolB family protein [Silicimonas sp.]